MVLMIDLEKLEGKKYGLLTILKAYRNDKHEKICLCKCTCGKEKKVRYSNMKRGKTKSCGHLEAINRKRYVNLINNSFGNLTVIGKTNNRREGMIIWKCKCSCGRSVFATSKQLKRGYVKDCGYHDLDKLIGRNFGELSVTGFSFDKKYIYCNCSCGKKAIVEKQNLLNGHTRSCGHLKNLDYSERVDGIKVSMLTTKLYKTNTSGYTGVSKRNNGKWVAYITLDYKRYFLGEYNYIEQAINARKNAEEKLYSPLLRKYESTKIK